MMKVKLSIIIPVYNEAQTLKEIVQRVQEVPFEKEMIIVDDASTDGTKEVLQGLEGDNIKKVFHEKNQGKGAAIKSAIAHIQGDIAIIQDADLEYHPDEYPILIKPITKQPERISGRCIFYSPSKNWGIFSIAV